jgi:hypothetical protein
MYFGGIDYYDQKEELDMLAEEVNQWKERFLFGPQRQYGRYGEVNILDPTKTQTPARSQTLY